MQYVVICDCLHSLKLILKTELIDHLPKFEQVLTVQRVCVCVCVTVCLSFQLLNIVDVFTVGYCTQSCGKDR